jgi:hypothetical protein
VQLKELCTEKQKQIILRFYKLGLIFAPSLFRESECWTQVDNETPIETGEMSFVRAVAVQNWNRWNELCTGSFHIRNQNNAKYE